MLERLRRGKMWALRVPEEGSRGMIRLRRKSMKVTQVLPPIWFLSPSLLPTPIDTDTNLVFAPFSLGRNLPGSHHTNLGFSIPLSAWVLAHAVDLF
jgi:hypothetical protein